MLHPGSVGAVHSHGGVVEDSQQVLADVPHLGGVLLQAHEDEPQVVTVQFHELGPHHFGGLIVPAMRMNLRLSMFYTRELTKKKSALVL